MVSDALLSRRDSQNGETDRGDKSFSCGLPVWGLAFGPRPPKSPAGARPARTSSSKGNNSLLLATGLENGVIKIWNVLTGDLFLLVRRMFTWAVFTRFLTCFLCIFQVMLYLIFMAMRALWGTWSSLRTGRSHSYHLLGTRLWLFGTWLTKVCAVKSFFQVFRRVMFSPPLLC